MVNTVPPIPLAPPGETKLPAAGLSFEELPVVQKEDSTWAYLECNDCRMSLPSLKFEH